MSRLHLHLGARGARKRLDQALSNAAWRTQFPDATVLHVPRTKLDHSPLVIKFANPPHQSNARPFRYQAAWTTHKDFWELVAVNWHSDQPITTATNNVKKTLHLWNCKSFGNIFQKKAKLLRRLVGI
ncbi:hypothetical protein Tsubulata_008617 [Turnera subulata]|uniref:Reverse transcriptase zinc-binding domain-containing protein n=1 Tax=Turnera subulata TaxID=218843 RepID=A0A9Q0FRP2_9ROSI|nr:hypothetical protein Tsubulata_008617 [Turnera subulata]